MLYLVKALEGKTTPTTKGKAMNRQEALNAMRQGKQVHHGKEGNRVVCYIADGRITVPYSDYTIKTTHWFLNAEYDEGWEVVKKKVKKTYWVNLYSIEKKDRFDTSWATLDKESLVGNKDIDNYIGTFPIEVEVEE